MPLEAFYLPTASGRLFCLLHSPDKEAPVRGGVIYVHPFAEEMNKSRRMAALQARAMAEAGYAVLQVDLLGCGDSAGDFADATWDVWVENLVDAGSWLRNRTGTQIWWWGLRVGGLLAAAAAGRIGQPCRMLLWQPVLLGKHYLQQFLRLKVAGELLGGGAKGTMERVKEQLTSGMSVEIAGYLLSPALARGLDAAELVVPEVVQRLEMMEISANEAAEVSPAVRARLEKLRAVGVDGRATAVVGPAFWQTTEIEECPGLIAASLRVLAEADAQ